MEEIKERLYQEIKRRYANLDNLTKKMENLLIKIVVRDIL